MKIEKDISNEFKIQFKLKNNSFRYDTFSITLCFNYLFKKQKKLNIKEYIKSILEYLKENKSIKLNFTTKIMYFEKKESYIKFQICLDTIKNFAINIIQKKVILIINLLGN